MNQCEAGGDNDTTFYQLVGAWTEQCFKTRGRDIVVATGCTEQEERTLQNYYLPHHQLYRYGGITGALLYNIATFTYQYSFSVSLQPGDDGETLLLQAFSKAFQKHVRKRRLHLFGLHFLFLVDIRVDRHVGVDVGDEDNEGVSPALVRVLTVVVTYNHRHYRGWIRGAHKQSATRIVYASGVRDAFGGHCYEVARVSDDDGDLTCLVYPHRGICAVDEM